MENVILGFLTGGSLIFAIGPQNLFVIEQGLKKNFIFTVTTICTISDILLIFLGVFIYHIFDFISPGVEIILNLILIVFLINFIKDKIKDNKKIKIKITKKNLNLKNTVLKTLGFTYLNPHVYSDTVFFLGNFSKNFALINKIYFGLGATISSFLFFFTIGYLANYLSKYLNNKRTWFYINILVILFMTVLSLYVLNTILNFY